MTAVALEPCMLEVRRSKGKAKSREAREAAERTRHVWYHPDSGIGRGAFYPKAALATPNPILPLRFSNRSERSAAQSGAEINLGAGV